MRIRMKIAMSGLRNGQPWPPVGEVAELPTGEAQHLCASGIAEEVEEVEEETEAEAGPVETATPAPAEITQPPAAEVTAPAAETKRSRPRKTTPPKE